MKRKPTNTLSPEKLKEIKREVAEGLARNRHTLICYFPFTGNISSRFELIPVRDARCRTACTDGKSVYFDCDFYSKLNEQERVFVLAHEIWHNVMLHLSRKQTRDHDLFNMATDMEVNHILKLNSDSNFLVPPEEVLFPPKKLEGKSAEEIYDWLLKEQKKNKKKDMVDADLPDAGNATSGSSSSPGKKNKDKNGNNDPQKDKSDSKGDKSNNTDNDKKSKLSGQFDSHTYLDDEIDDELNGDNEDIEGNGGNGDGNDDAPEGNWPSDQWGEVGFDDDFRPKVSKEYSEKMREMVVSAAQQTERQQGRLPAGIDGLLDKLKRPEINWRDELCNFVTQCYGGDRQWLPPNRRYVYNDTYFQSRRSQQINVAVCIDTSGSCIGDLPKFFGELKGLVESFGQYTIHLIQCDAAVDSYEVYDDCNPLELDVEQDIEWSGGGGTSFVPPFKFIEENGIDVDCIVYLTDGYGDAPQNPPEFPTLWIIAKDGCMDFCDWGKKIQFKESSFD